MKGKSWIKIIIAVGIIISLTFGVVACGGQGQNQKADSPKEERTPINLRWGTISAGGAWQIVGSAMLEDIVNEHKHITGTILPSATAANVVGVHEGTFDIAFSLTDTTYSAWEGTGFFKDKGEIKDLRNVATLYPQATHLIVWDNSNIKGIEDLKGKRVSPGARGLSSDLQASKLLELYGMSYNDMKVEFLSFDDGTQAMIDGHLDALLYTAVPYPFAPVVKVNARSQIRFLEIPIDKANKLAEAPGVEVFVLPGNLYKGIDYGTQGIAVRAHIIVREDMPEDIVYDITKTIAENFKRYGDVIAVMKNSTRENMTDDAGIPLHPGAERYYREQGLIK
ncbi:MAG: TAXI family TRAP transporter solute-binding subunit [Clostridia bacterium]|jgi:TRAP transporter TAXI family solute receptor|nr:TAXI family TRAP transporter solute-binding subunit [Clostridia bacterium]